MSTANGSMSTKFNALICFPDGEVIESCATKTQHGWTVGGDKPEAYPSGTDFLVESTKDGRKAWFKLQGCYLLFQDYIN